MVMVNFMKKNNNIILIHLISALIDSVGTW